MPRWSGRSSGPVGCAARATERDPVVRSLAIEHWRHGRSEVDLVLDDFERPLAFEVGSSPDHSRAGLAALIARHPRFAGGCYLVAPQVPLVHPEATGRGIGTVPLDALLIASGRHAEAALRRNLSAGGG